MTAQTEGAASCGREIGEPNMKLLVKYLKPFVLPALLCILLLFGQAMCDLTLPNMMSDIVNTGISRAASTRRCREVMNASGVELLAVFMDDEEEADFRAAYTPVEQGGSREAALAEDYTAIGDVQAVEMTGDARGGGRGSRSVQQAAYAFLTFLQSLGEQAGETLERGERIQTWI